MLRLLLRDGAEAVQEQDGRRSSDRHQRAILLLLHGSARGYVGHLSLHPVGVVAPFFNNIFL